MVGELGEVAELLKKDAYHGRPPDPSTLAKEAGDLLWDMALYADVAGFPFEPGRADDHFTVYGHPFEMMRLISALMNAERPFRSVVANTIAHLDRILCAYGLAMADAAQLNIDKLKRRYPEGFTLEAANSHDSQ